jgi:hypothetical protein
MGGGIGRTHEHQLLVNREAFLNPAFGSQIAGLSAQDFRIIGQTCQESSEELDFEIDLTSLGKEPENRPWWV